MDFVQKEYIKQIKEIREEKYDISIPDRILPTLVTVKDIVTYLEENAKG